ncbi:MAG: glycosyltransferase family 39 protein, partial [Planctomycetota bacterium]
MMVLLNSVIDFAKKFRSVGQAIFGLGIAIAVIAGFSSGVVNKQVSEIYPYAFPEETQWIAPQGEAQSAAVFRLDFQLPPKKVARGWVCIAADNGFEVIMNSNPVGRWSLYRATRPFQSGHSEYGQRLRFQPTAIGLNFPREYQWDDHKNYQLPTLLDVTRYLKSGFKNSLSVTAEARHPNPAFALHGEIVFEDGTKMQLNSNTAWKGSYVPFGSNAREWTFPHFPIDHWPQARKIRRPIGNLFRVPPEGIYETPFNRKWRLAPSKGEAIFRTTLNVEEEFDSAWIRILSGGPYLFRLNGQCIRPMTGPGYHYSQALWVAQPANRRWLAVFPEQMDPDETGGAHVGDNFLNPSHGNMADQQFEVSESQLDLSQDSTADPSRGDLLRRQYEDKPNRPGTTDPLAEMISSRMPTVLTRRHAKPDLVGFDISAWLKKGKNEIEIELIQFQRDYKMPNSRRIAVDAAILQNGELKPYLTDSQPWTINGQPCLTGIKPLTNQMVQKFYRIAQPAGFPHYIVFFSALFGSWIAIALMFTGGLLDEFRIKKSVGPIWSAALVVILAVALKISLAERSEYLWFITNKLWEYMTLATALVVGLTLSRFKYGPEKTLRPPENKHFYRVMLLIVLFVGLLIRYTGVDDQPLDDDEYASVQTTLNIAKSGLPEIYKGIWYTRGPVYHYLAGGLIYLFGDNIWVMRFPAIMAGLVAAVFTYLISSRVVKSRAIGIAGALIICVNPFCA